MSDTLSTPSLSARHADLTQRTILDAAVGLLAASSVPELTVRAIAARAGISERTVFRYFPAREDLLGAVAAEVTRRFELPADPRDLDELLAYPEALYRRFEASADLTRAALHSELYDRIRLTSAQRRWASVQKVLEHAAPRASPCERKLAAANIRYHLSATAWHYYRFYFGFPIEDAIACARLSVEQAVAGLAPRARSTKGR
jgi:AcrR family transcriptional regulator